MVHFTVVETPDNTFILNKDYPTVAWYARDRKALVELFPCSKEDIGVYPDATDAQHVEDPEITAFLNYLMRDIAENFNLSKEESKGLKKSLSEKLTAENYKNI